MKSYNIYIVEDLGVTRATLSNILTRNGHTVIGSSATAEKAWIDLETLTPDLLLLDLNLKGSKSGLWLAEKIREELHLPFIFITAYGSNEILDKITSIESDGYIMKPFNNVTLLANIQLAVANFNKLSDDSLNRSDESKYYVAKTKNGIQRIEITTIYYIQSSGNYVTIYLENTDLVIREKLDKIIEDLNVDYIQKTHRRYAVNISKLTRVHKETVYIGSIEVPVSNTYVSNIESKFLK